MFHHVPSFFSFSTSTWGFIPMLVSPLIMCHLYIISCPYFKVVFSIFATLTCSRSFALYVDLQLKVVCYPNSWCFTPQYVYMIIYYIRSPTMLATVYIIYISYVPFNTFHFISQIIPWTPWNIHGFLSPEKICNLAYPPPGLVGLISVRSPAPVRWG